VRGGIIIRRQSIAFDQRRPHPRFPDRAKTGEEAVEFFIRLLEAPIEKIAVENW
jgi:hypothetical protein